MIPMQTLHPEVEMTPLDTEKEPRFFDVPDDEVLLGHVTVKIVDADGGNHLLACLEPWAALALGRRLIEKAESLMK
jgi:hypothetical protein